jgi:putative membrane protein
VGFLIRILSTLLGLWTASHLVTGFGVQGGWQGYLIASIVLVVLNLILRPILKLVSFPLVMITFGLFSIVLNALILWLASQISGYITIGNIWALLWATIIISIINIFTHYKKQN